MTANLCQLLSKSNNYPLYFCLSMKEETKIGQLSLGSCCTLASSMELSDFFKLIGTSI